MNPLTLEWIESAEGDFATAGRELRARKNPNYDAACFHAQQCAEKYLKAILQEQSIWSGFGPSAGDVSVDVDAAAVEGAVLNLLAWAGGVSGAWGFRGCGPWPGRG